MRKRINSSTSPFLLRFPDTGEAVNACENTEYLDATPIFPYCFSQRSNNDHQHLPHYCWNVMSDGVGQRPVSVVVPGINPFARRVQHSPSVEE